jgi:hypothetical protein
MLLGRHERLFLGKHGDGQFHGFAAIANFQARSKIVRNVV